MDNWHIEFDEKIKYGLADDINKSMLNKKTKNKNSSALKLEN